MNLVTIGLDGRTTEPAYTISSPRAFGSGELKMQSNFYYLFSILNYKTKQNGQLLIQVTTLLEIISERT